MAEATWPQFFRTVQNKTYWKYLETLSHAGANKSTRCFFLIGGSHFEGFKLKSCPPAAVVLYHLITQVRPIKGSIDLQNTFLVPRN